MTEYIKSEKGYFYKNINNKKERISKELYYKNVQNTGSIKNNQNFKNNFDYFLENSNIEYLSEGSGGIIFIANLDTNYESPYVYLHHNKYNEQIRQIIFKLIFLNENVKEKSNEKSNENIIKIGKYEFNITTIKSFKKEINIQTEIFKKTVNYLEPYCPEILYAEIYDKNNINIFIEKIKKKLKQNSSKYLGLFMLKNIKKLSEDNSYEKLGIIGMEFAEGYKTLHSYRNEISYQKYNLYKNMCLYLLIKLAIDTGYTHGDFHPSNIMINPTYFNYFKNIYGAPLIIDFGYAKKISEDNLILINNYFNEKKYSEILKLLCQIGRSNELNMTNSNYDKFYGWVYGTYNYYIKTKISMTENMLNNLNNHLDILNNAHEEAKKELEKNTILLNNIKNKIFNGLNNN